MRPVVNGAAWRRWVLAGCVVGGAVFAMATAGDNGLWAASSTRSLAGDSLPAGPWKVGSAVPDFGFTDVAGKHHTLSEFRGKYVLVTGWGTWSHACIQEVPYLKAAYAKYGPARFEIIGLNSEEEPDDGNLTPIRARVNRFIADSGITWVNASTVFQQREGESVRTLWDRFQFKSVPALALLDPEGRVVAVGTQNDRLRGKGLVATLDSLLSAAAR